MSDSRPTDNKINLRAFICTAQAICLIGEG